MAAVHHDSDSEACAHLKALHTCAFRPQVVAEAGGWSAFIPGLPIAGDGATFDELADAVREYAEDWQDHLADAPNHADNWGLVRLVGISDDARLRDRLLGAVHGRHSGE